MSGVTVHAAGLPGLGGGGGSLGAMGDPGMHCKLAAYISGGGGAGGGGLTPSRLLLLELGCLKILYS